MGLLPRNREILLSAGWWLLPGVASLAAGVSLVVWLSNTGPRFSLRVPPLDEQPLLKPQAASADLNTGTLIPGPGLPSDLEGSWTQFRGSDRLNIVQSPTAPARSWPEQGLSQIWSMDLGEGHAGAAIHRGRVYVVDYDRDKEEDAIRCLSLDDGQEIWRYTYSVRIKRNHGMSRTVPAVTDAVVVALGPLCHVHALNAETGELLWKKDLVKECGTEAPAWYAGQCPLIDGDQVILAPGGNPLMMSVDLVSGEVRWQTPNPGGWGMTHSSVVALDYQGQRQYVYCTTQGVVGVSGQDGSLLWKKPDWKITIANVPSPVAVPGDRLFLSGGYKSGCVMLKLTGENPIQTEEVFRLGPDQFGSEQQTALLYEDHIYGVIPNGELACLSLEGKILWTSGKDHRFGLGPFLCVNGVLLALEDQTGELNMIALNPNSYQELAVAKVLEGHDAWGPMAMVQDRLILRDLTRMICLKLPS